MLHLDERIFQKSFLDCGVTELKFKSAETKLVCALLFAAIWLHYRIHYKIIMSKNLDNNVMTSDDEDIDADLKPGFLLPANSEEKEFKYIGLMAWHRRLCR